MIDQLPPAHLQREGVDLRAQLDSDLGVATWAGLLEAPIVARPEPVVTEEGEVLEPPAWWYGAEEATQSFLRAQGVVIED